MANGFSHGAFSLLLLATGSVAQAMPETSADEREVLAEIPKVHTITHISKGFVRQLFLATGPGAAPEQVDSLEFGYLFDRSLTGLSFDLSLFYERLKDAGAELLAPGRVRIRTDRGGRLDDARL